MRNSVKPRMVLGKCYRRSGARVTWNLELWLAYLVGAVATEEIQLLPEMLPEVVKEEPEAD